MNRWLLTFGLSFLIGSTIVLMWTFYTAYFNTGFKTTIYVNNFGEAHFEAVTFIILSVIAALFVYTYLKEEKVRFNGAG